MSEVLTPDLVLWAYENGYFPMAETDTGEIYWHSPDPRAIVPLEAVRVPRSLRKVIRENRFDIRFDTSFEQVIRACAARDETWISPEIIDVYTTLNRLGFAHSVEAWQHGKLVGGLYGITLGAAFFGESMFSMVSEASKVAYIFLVELLRDRDFRLLDSQYLNSHMESLGAVEIPRHQFLRLLHRALQCPRTFV